MLTHQTLVALYRELLGDKVLSIYLDGQATDPAERSVWRRRLEQQLGDAERRLQDEPSEEQAGFQNALSLLKEELGWFDAFLPGKGWVGFATADRVVYSETVSVPMPDLVRWERGIRVAPYVRGLKQGRGVTVVLADRRHARVFAYRDGDAEELPGVVADTDVGDLTDVGVAKRGGTHSGVRGQTGTDAARRFLDAGAERMMKRLMEDLAERVDGDGFLLLGGTPETVSALAQQASPQLAGRLLERPSLHTGMSPAEVRDAAEAAVSELTERLQEGLVTEVSDLAHSGGRGCLGSEATVKALLEGRVDVLLLTRSFIRENPDFADRCVGSAFDQQAEVEELSGSAAQGLDSQGGGIGARLRFLLKSQEPSEPQGFARDRGRLRTAEGFSG